jgi:formiminotetrahydrofolate cyclodeaminase
MLQMKPSNLLMACLLSAKASALLITPANAATSLTAAETVVSSAIEVEVINLKTNVANNADSEVLTAQSGQDYDQTQDRDQTQDQDQRA